MPTECDVVQVVTTLAPGTFSAVQTHGGTNDLTVLEGEVTGRTVAETAAKVKAGDSALQAPGEFAQVGNAGTVTSQYVTAVLLPRGGVLTTQQDLAAPLPAGLTTCAHTFNVTRPNGPFDFVQFTLTSAPGALTPLHTHGGEASVTVLEGAITFTSGGTTLIHPAGASSVGGANEVGQAMNLGSRRATVVATFLLPRGAALTTNQ